MWKIKMNRMVWLLKSIATIGLWLYALPELLNPSNVPFRFLLDGLKDVYLNFMLFSLAYLIYFIFVVFISHKVIWSNTLTQKIKTEN
ncbi:transporter [Bacillus thuringiensis serovar ostriniae]|uniref:Transporter n=1 Tax=Bacillus wiedmannii TaxID=1890302 RepID=A0A242Z325_9BACI|nr:MULTISPECIES: transporter [Bacillus cereus group]OTX86863.1 transporter [Bacillus wiedmannii]OTZ80820.1 transporter [Bacillus thuringiensis serovar ostriniae]PFA92950.1 transporter [Bacillus cereus]